MKVVLDTNVLLAGIATHGLCEGLLAILFRDHRIILSEHILDELAEHYVGKFKATPQQVSFVVSSLRSQCEVISPDEFTLTDFDDPDDLPILGTATAAHADYLVTGDKDLLELKSFQGIAILSPRQFYDLLRVEP